MLRRGLQQALNIKFRLLASGASLADAMEKHAVYFDELCLSVVHVGENTGQLTATDQQPTANKERPISK